MDKNDNVKLEVELLMSKSNLKKKFRNSEDKKQIIHDCITKVFCELNSIADDEKNLYDDIVYLVDDYCDSFYNL